jgi:outer membrane protein assembly factor BamB
MRGRFAIIAVAFLALAGAKAHAVITAAAPLAKFEGDSVYIVVGKVDKHFPDKPAMLITITEDIKGKAPFRTLPINCKVADEADFKKNLIDPLLKRFGPDQEIIFFLDPIGSGKTYKTFAFTNGTWFQLHGTQVGKEQAVFSLKSAEPYFRKSFKGTTAELHKLLKEHAAGKAKFPPLDDKEPAGFGPEYEAKKTGARGNPQESLRSSWGLGFLMAPSPGGGGPLFGVIPTLGVGAPLAILALLFPTVFGGVFVLFRQWLAFITVISLNSTLVLLSAWLGMTSYRNEWWTTDAILWIVMTGITFACLLWAWRRHLNALAAGDAEAPRKTEMLILLLMSATCTVTMIVLWFMTPKISWAAADWTLTVVLTLSIFAGTLYRGFRSFKREPLFGAPSLTTEGVILGAMALGYVVFVPAIFGVNVNTQGDASGKDQSGQLSAKVAPVREVWTFQIDPRRKGMYASNPVIDGDALYASYSGTNNTATLYRLERQTGIKKWEFFGKDDDLRQMISTPCLANGKLYFGEGFHYDKNCHVFCVDAEKGEEIWRFKTGGQTESSPTVVNGKVYIGAGNDGVYCLDAKDGTKIWRYPHDDVGAVTRVALNVRIQRFGGGMVVIGDRLYCGTGVDREAKDDKGETAIFCFEAATGKMIWKTPAPYPIWSTPVVKDGRIYVTSGNGDVLEDVPPPEKPGGALQCLDADTGKELWQRTYPNGIIEAPAVDGHYIYFGCRDRHVYCVSRADGKDRWEKPYYLDSAIIATPVLDSDPVYERTMSIFVATTLGKVCCMNAQTGDIVWTFDLTPRLAVISATPRLVVTRTVDGYRRQLYFGCGIGGAVDPLANRPVFYCLEDKIGVE